MVYIIVTTSFPVQKGTETAKKYVEERRKNPPDRSLGKEILQSALRVVKGRVKTMSITEVKEGKLDEALIRTQNVMVPYHELEDYKYTIKVYLNVVEALKMVGMETPE